MIERLRQKDIEYFVTASTGIAAVNIGGTTIHSFAGIGTGSKGSHELISSILSNAEARQRWENCAVLIIDEVSMISRDLFERLEIIARAIKKSNRPFGGIQLILSGDFTQLKPVTSIKLNNEELFCFASPIWEVCVDLNVFLTDNYRQNEPELRHILDEFRSGNLSEHTMDFIKTHLTRPLNCDPFDVVRLFPHKDKVSEANDKFLVMLPGEQHVYHAYDTGSSQALQKCPAPRNLLLKLKARVVLIKNLSEKLVNGLRGSVVRFIGSNPLVQFDNCEVQLLKEEMFIVEDSNGNVAGTRKQVPLDLAFCLTIHKSQGMEFEFVEVDLSDVFDPGQAYVAVSRAKTMDGLRILGVQQNLPKTCKIVDQFYREKVINVSDINMDQFLREQKKSTTNVLQFIDINSCQKIASVVSNPAEFVFTEEHEFTTISPQCFDEINSKVRKIGQISNDISCILAEVEKMEGVHQFCTWLWNVYHQMHGINGSTQGNPLVIERKKLTLITAKLHSLNRSNQMLCKWKEYLDKNIKVDISISGNHRKMAVSYCRATYEVFLHHISNKTNDDSDNHLDQVGNEERSVADQTCLTNEAMGKIRDIGGWVVYKEVEFCVAYIRDHKGSISPNCVEKVALNRRIKVLLDLMKDNKTNVLSNTNYPESLEHITIDDKRGKTYITDSVFEFFNN
jgi:hypothetical protein